MVQAFVVEQCSVRERCSSRLGAATRTWRVEQLTSNIVTSSPRVQAKEQKGNQMDEGVLRTSSHASIKPNAHNNLLWHWTLFEVRNSAAD